MEGQILSAVKVVVEDALKRDSNLSSWQRCHRLFGNAGQDRDYLALQLGFFLASFGMMRGSSFLRKFDYSVHLPVVDILTANTSDLRDAVPKDETTIDKIVAVKSRIDDVYRKLGAREGDIDATDTLSSKIMMAALGCVPAYDRYVVAGFRFHKIIGRFNNRSLRQINEHLLRNMAEYEEARGFAEAKLEAAVPYMRLVDMYFILEGKRVEQEREAKKRAVSVA